MVDRPTPLSVLNTVFGYAEFRGHQADVIDHVVAGGDALVLMPTGSGKSLCFQAPAVVPPIPGRTGSPRQGVALVVSPLISLMKDQVDGLRVDGVAASFLNSTQTSSQRDEVIASLREDRARRRLAAGGDNPWPLEHP